jgi:16S rRNA A1518/A1519 N6-dimethyltransferase RsmA/KsgA/DIM1 with predicted DNA glycosylase/AP lyase activity
MGAEVTKRVQGTPLAKKLEVILGDVIKMPEMPSCDALISNTPYQISSPLIFKMLSMPNPPRVAVLMVRFHGRAVRQSPADNDIPAVSTRVCQETGCEAG